jgi:DNA-binding response OmpR family regulator
LLALGGEDQRPNAGTSLHSNAIHSKTMTALSVLIITPDLTIGELVHAMLESEGCPAYRPRDDESILGALDRLRPSVALVDCDGMSSDERLFERAKELGILIVMFSASRDRQQMRRVVRDGYPWFTLPISRHDLTQLLHAELRSAPTRPEDSTRAQR